MKRLVIAAVLLCSNFAVAATTPGSVYSATETAPVAASEGASTTTAQVSAPTTVVAPTATEAPVTAIPVVAAPAAEAAPAPKVNNTTDSPLEAQLQGLQVPSNMAPAGVTSERLYSVQNRFAPLKSRSEIDLGGAYDFRGNGYMTMTEIDLNYRYNFNDKWHVNLGGGYSFNSLNSSGKELVKNYGRLADSDFPKSRAFLLVGYNTFYGKLRFTMDSVAYFDQYIAIGPGIVNLDSGNATSGVADIGFAFWMKKWGSLRVGMRNEIFKEKRELSSSMTHHMIGHIDFGIMLGGAQ